MNSFCSQSTIISVLRLFNIRYTSDYIHTLLERNSDIHNLWGILEILQIYGIIVKPRKVTNQLELKNKNINKPFITEYDNNILLVKKITENDIFVCLNGKDRIFCKDKFLPNWSGVMVYIYKGKSVGEPNIDRHIKNIQFEWIFKIAITLSIITMYAYKISFYYVPWYIGICFLMSCLGAMVTYQIEYSHFSSNSIFNNLCSIFKHSACNKINSSKSSCVTALGFSYFFSLCLFILLPLDNYALTISIITVSLIEVVWSLLLQLFRNEFCIKCMSIQIIVIVMALIAILNLERSYLQIYISQGLLYLAIFTIIFSVSYTQIWTYIENRHKFMIKSRLLDSFKKRYMEHFIYTEKPIITLFLNPYCNPCKEEILEAYNLLINQEGLKVIPIIIVSGSNGEKVGKYLLGGMSTTSIFHRLKEWYSWGYRNLSDFEKKFMISSDDEVKLSSMLKENLDLAHSYNVQHTPAIICNGKRQPEGISLIDVLTHLI